MIGQTKSCFKSTSSTIIGRYSVQCIYLYSCEVRSEVDVGLLEMRGPGREQTGPELLVKVTYKERNSHKH